LEKALRNSPQETFGRIFIAIFEMATNSTGCVTLVESYLENTNEYIRWQIDSALLSHTPKPEIMPVLMWLFEKGNDSTKGKVCNLLIKMRTNAITAKPLLESALANPDLTNRYLGLRMEGALRNIQGIVWTNYGKRPTNYFRGRPSFNPPINAFPRSGFISNNVRAKPN
jgi:hypothetical protein